MALATGTIWEVRASATTGNTGGAGFNTANANFPTDGAATVATGNSPVLTSATYTFVAGDVGAWVYVKSGSNWTPGWYQIASVSAGAATLSAAVGQAVQVNATTGILQANTVAGCATTASPTGGTYGVDYSQQDAANSTVTNLASVGSSTTLTSASNPWTPVSVGNIIHITTTGTGAHFVTGWYEIVSESLVSSVTLDRTPNDGTAGVAGTGQTGGAGRLNGLEDAFLEAVPAGSQIWVKNGSYTISGTISIASTNSTSASPSFLIGYNSLRGDTCIGTNRPVITCAANNVTFGQFQNTSNMIFTATTSAGISYGTGAETKNCKFTNTSTTASRAALTMNGTGCSVIDCECVSQNGVGISVLLAAFIEGCYVHDCVTGVSAAVAATVVTNNLFECNSTDAFNCTVASPRSLFLANTFYGREAKMGNGINLSNATTPGSCRFVSNIFYGLAAGITVSTAEQKSNTGTKNDYSNNTANGTNWTPESDFLALNPSFSGATQITGTTATTSGSVLTQSGGDFSTVTDNVDYLRVVSGTGVTVGGYLITSHTSTTLTVNNALGTSSGGDVTYFVGTGHNFQIGTNLAGQGFPGFANVGSETTGYPSTGAVQRNSSGSGGTVMIF